MKTYFEVIDRLKILDKEYSEIENEEYDLEILKLRYEIANEFTYSHSLANIEKFIEEEEFKRADQKLEGIKAYFVITVPSSKCNIIVCGDYKNSPDSPVYFEIDNNRLYSLSKKEVFSLAELEESRIILSEEYEKKEGVEISSMKILIDISNYKYPKL